MTHFGRRSGSQNYISAANLLLEYRVFIDTHRCLSAVNTGHNCWPQMVGFCEELEAFPEAMRSLTLLHAQSQMDFERALFCSWMSLLVARYLQMENRHQRALFFAGLMQDLGKHALDAEIKDYLANINAPFSAAIKPGHTEDMHPLVSSTYVEQLLPEVHGLPELVLHHHAREDGTGFPRNVGESQLDVDAQILIIANQLSDRLDCLGGHNQLDACLPMIKLSSKLFFQRVYEAWFSVLRPHIEEKRKIKPLKYLQLDILAKRDQLEALMESLLNVSAALLSYDYDVNIHGLRALIHKLATLFADTGLLNRKGLCKRRDIPEEILIEADYVFCALPEFLERCNQHLSYIIESKKIDGQKKTLQQACQLLQENLENLQEPSQGQRL